VNTSATSTKSVHELKSVPIDEIWPSPENQELYRPVTPDDPETIRLADSIRSEGVKEPLVITQDGYILSGHRRHVAARMAGLRKIPCRYSEISHDDPRFVKELATHNLQRIKTRDEVLHEAVVNADPEKAHKALTAYRRRKAKIKVESIEIHETRGRSVISSAKMEFLHSVQGVIDELEEFWPLSLRQIFYQLINDPPLIHSSKPGSRFRNNKPSYRALIDLATRARHEGYLDYDVIDDATRPITTWDVHANLSGYYTEQMEDLLNGYWRNLMQSQPNHVEIIVEKNTMQSVFRPVAAEFCIPITFGRGQCTTSPLSKVAKRYKASGKDKLIILAVSDLDPDGDAIAHSIGQRLRDDFVIRQVETIKVALTMKQIERLRLPENYERAKKKSPSYPRYIERYHTDFVWELEAVDYRELQRLLKRAIDSVIDRAAFNHEVAEERKDAAHNAAVRETVLRTLREQISS
jgi:hypothetical protein